MGFIEEVINAHKCTKEYKEAEEAQAYYWGENPRIYNFEKLVYDFEGKAHKDIYSANHKISSNFFGFVVDQETSYLLGNGISFKGDTKNALKKLGADFDVRATEVYNKGAIEGTCFGFWNLDHLEVFPLVASDCSTAFAPLEDEVDGALKAGVRFWQIDETKPLRATLYELDGYTEYIKREDGDMELLTDDNGNVIGKKTYKQKKVESEFNGTQFHNGDNYPTFPIVPFKYNERGISKIHGKKNTIDALDLVTSNMINNVDEGNLIYWVLTNCNAMTDVDDANFLKQLTRTKVVHANGDDGVNAEPHTIEAPIASTIDAEKTLTERLYKDFQAVNPDALTSGNQTATAIRASYIPLDLLVDKTEKRFTDFLLKIFKLAGVDDTPLYNRNMLINKQEETQTILLGAEHFDDEYITKKLLAINGDIDEFEDLKKRKDTESYNRLEDTDPDTDVGGDNGIATTSEAIDTAEETVGKTLNGAQTQSLLAVMDKLSEGSLTEAQAINIISTAIGVTKDEAKAIIRGE